MKLEWKKRKTSYGDFVYKLYVGRWPVATVSHDIFKTVDSIVPIKATCELPGLHNKIGNYEDIVAAKEAAEKVVNEWLEGLNQ